MSLDIVTRKWQSDPRSTAELIATGLNGTEEAADDALWILRARATPEVFERAQALCRSDNSAEREFGVLILSQLGIPERKFREQSIAELLGVLEKEDDAAVLEVLCWGFGHLHAADAISHLSRLSHDVRPEIRQAVVGGLLCQEDEMAIETLLKLSADVDPEVRSWATFGLGTQIDADTPEIREALFARLSDPIEEIRCEAIWGLAKRKDGRAVEPLARILQSKSVASDDLKAAARSGDQRLLPVLLELRRHADCDLDLLESAIAQCSRDSEP